MKYLKFFENNNEDIINSLKDYIKDVDKNWNYITSVDLKKDLDKDPVK